MGQIAIRMGYGRWTRWTRLVFNHIHTEPTKTVHLLWCVRRHQKSKIDDSIRLNLKTLKLLTFSQTSEPPLAFGSLKKRRVDKNLANFGYTNRIGRLKILESYKCLHYIFTPLNCKVKISSMIIENQQ